MDKLIKLNSQTVGRDRLIRLLQYGSQMCAYLLDRAKFDKTILHRLKNLEAACSMGRKLLRLGRFVDTLYGVVTTAHLPDLVLRLTLTFSRVTQGIYLLMDHILWIGRAGVLGNIDNKKWARRSNKFWLVSIVLNLVRDFYEICRIAQTEVSQRRKRQRWSSMNPTCLTLPSAEGSCGQISQPVISCMQEYPGVVIDTVKNGCDLWIPMTSLGYVKLSPGMVGLFGVISSLVSIAAIINPVMKIQPS